MDAVGTLDDRPDEPRAWNFESDSHYSWKFTRRMEHNPINARRPWPDRKHRQNEGAEGKDGIPGD